MRLTTVSRMEVDPGIVCRFNFRAHLLDGDDLPISFDQRRHIELGRRSGSWMALAFRLPQRASYHMIAQAWCAVVERHGTLRTVIDDESGVVRLRPVRLEPSGWSDVPSEESRGSGAADPQSVLRRVFDQQCDPFSWPSHQLCVVESPAKVVLGDGGITAPTMTVVVGLDHSHTDAWSLLVLLRDFTSCLNDVREGREPGSCLPAVPTFAEHTRELDERPSPPRKIHQRWKDILNIGDGGMPIFPLDLGDISKPCAEVVEIRDVLDAAGVTELERYARNRGVRMISVALSVMAAGIIERTGTALRAVLPVHSRIGSTQDPSRWHNSVGWFITNSVIECSDPDPVKCSEDLREALTLGSYALEPVLRPYGGMPHTPGMFAISWLDNRKLPVEVAPSTEPQHVSAVIRTNGVMVWFVVNTAGLHIRARYPDTAQARSSVGQWLDEVCLGLELYAAALP